MVVSKGYLFFCFKTFILGDLQKNMPIYLKYNEFTTKYHSPKREMLMDTILCY